MSIDQSEANNQSIDQSEASIMSIDQSEASIHLVRRAVRVVVLVSAALESPAQRLDGQCRLLPHVLHHHPNIPDSTGEYSSECQGGMISFFGKNSAK